jgi:hypothetical protein
LYFGGAGFNSEDGETVKDTTDENVSLLEGRSDEEVEPDLPDHQSFLHATVPCRGPTSGVAVLSITTNSTPFYFFSDFF